MSEKDFINSIVTQDGLLNWNPQHLMSEKPSDDGCNQLNDMKSTMVKDKDCLSTGDVDIATRHEDSYSTVQLEPRANDFMIHDENNCAMDLPPLQNCDISQNTFTHQIMTEPKITPRSFCNGDDFDRNPLGLCNGSFSDHDIVDVSLDDDDFASAKSSLPASKSSSRSKKPNFNDSPSVIRRTSQRLAKLKDNKKVDQPEESNHSEISSNAGEPANATLNGVCGDADKDKAKEPGKDHEQKSKRRKIKESHGCNVCGQDFKLESELKTHMSAHDDQISKDKFLAKQEEEKQKLSLTCEQCALSFSHPQHFHKHMSGHNRNNCKMCSAQFAKRKALCRHLRTAHRVTEAEKFYPCFHCERKFIKRPSLYVHLKEHAGGKIVCMKCGLMCESEELHSKHMLKHTEEAKFFCNRCNESFLRRQQYEQHLNGHDKYDCTLCDINFSTKKHLLKHKRIVHGIQTREEKKHSCFICQKRFQRPMLLEIHMRLHTGEKPIQCTQCDKNFRTPKALAKHMKTAAHLKATGQDETEAVELDKPYLCAQCGMKFYRRQGLLRHMQQLHSEERPHSCPYCDYSCKCKTNLKRHMELHTEDRRFVCELCGASFHARATLKEHHAYVHSEDRNFVCSVCGKGFKGRSGLRRHVRIHSDARPYVCYCAQSYKRMSHLKRHMIAIHGALFKSKRVSKIGGDENSQSSSTAGSEGDHALGKGEDSLNSSVQNAVVEMLRNISPPPTAADPGQVPLQEFLPQDLMEMSPGRPGLSPNANLSLPPVSPLHQASLPHPPAQMFSSDVPYPSDFHMIPSAQDPGNHFTFCMSLAQSAFNLAAAQAHVSSVGSLVPEGCLYPPAVVPPLLLSNLQDNSEIKSEEGGSGVPSVFAHSPS